MNYFGLVTTDPDEEDGAGIHACGKAFNRFGFSPCGTNYQYRIRTPTNICTLSRSSGTWFEEYFRPIQEQRTPGLRTDPVSFFRQ
ncbi:MAG TPA: hypothetical protein VE604_01030, partial [Candidatus Polarisedimenticolia bacterium]|nr:hypothetical protein [Candidatus Polarisedimenticolia bacterium]